MIVSASYKTDIPAFYGAWFLARLEAGYVRVVNPYGGADQTVSLGRDAVDGFVFWTRNAGPFLPALETVAKRDDPFVVQYTITGYPRALDTGTLPWVRAVDDVRGLVRIFGNGRVVWRYDPIVVTSLTPTSWHEDTFAALARALEGAVDEVVVSFAHVYRKTARNMTAAARAHGFDWRDPGVDEKRDLLARLAGYARRHGIALTLCGQPELLCPGVVEASCIDASRLAAIAGSPLRAARKPHRPRCGCWASKDIGDYDTCPHGCVYCYAVNSRARAKQRHQRHDPRSPFLIPLHQTQAK
ncbi:MAG: DUF1848 domain-containing protein [Rhodospirillales bacterium]|nr:DUF1848 domain-containing protein [Rhodospirillales bacterium]